MEETLSKMILRMISLAVEMDKATEVAHISMCANDIQILMAAIEEKIDLRIDARVTAILAEREKDSK